MPPKITTKKSKKPTRNPIITRSSKPEEEPVTEEDSNLEDFTTPDKNIDQIEEAKGSSHNNSASETTPKTSTPKTPKMTSQENLDKLFGYLDKLITDKESHNLVGLAKTEYEKIGVKIGEKELILTSPWVVNAQEHNSRLINLPKDISSLDDSIIKKSILTYVRKQTVALDTYAKLLLRAIEMVPDQALKQATPGESSWLVQLVSWTDKENRAKTLTEQEFLRKSLEIERQCLQYEFIKQTKEIQNLKHQLFQQKSYQPKNFSSKPYSKNSDNKNNELIQKFMHVTGPCRDWNFRAACGRELKGQTCPYDHRCIPCFAKNVECDKKGKDCESRND